MSFYNRDCDPRLLELGEAASIIAEDAQVFAGHLEGTTTFHLTGPEALRLYAKRLAHLSADLHPSTLAIFDREPIRLPLPKPPKGSAVGGD